MEQSPGLNGESPQPPRVHDPLIVREDGVYYLFSTGRGVSVHTSRDMATWHKAAPLLHEAPAWAVGAVPGSREHFWAPDVAFFNERWHLYYSVSTFGSNCSAIGLATGSTLDAESGDYGWRDEGIVVASQPGGNWNAIDPHMARDEDGRLWLALGSFWSGLKLLPIDNATGKPRANAPLLAIAARPRTPEIQGSIEGAFIVWRHGFYYLFASFDFCCRKAASTYNIRVGRSEQITGPYVDRQGQPMLEGGGTLVRSGDERWRGPGHNTIYSEDGVDWLVYHAYDALDEGKSKLHIERLGWDEEGWPQVIGEAASTCS